MILDASVRQQSYIEDCEVCCNPIQIHVISDGTSIQNIDANSIEQ